MLPILQFIFADFWHWLGSFFILYLLCQTFLRVVVAIVVSLTHHHIEVDGIEIEDDDDDTPDLQPVAA